MLKPRTIAIVILMSAILLLGGAAAALAAPPAWQSVDVALHENQGRRILLVTGHLPPDAQLPATVELAVPAGAELVWIGELLGGPASEDPTVENTVARVGTTDVYSFRLTKARDAQLEVVASDAVVPNGGAYTASVEWTPSQDIPLVTMSVLLPKGAQVTKPSADATLQPGPNGDSFYATRFTTVKAGQELSLTFSYTQPAGSAPAAVAAPTAQPQSDLSIPLLLFAAFLVAVLFVGRGVGRRLSAKETGAEEAPDESEGLDDVTDDRDPGTSDPAVDDATPARPAPGKGMRSMRIAITVGLVTMLAIVFGALLLNARQPAVSSDTISKVFSSQDPCATATIPLTLPDGVDADEAAGRIFDILQTTDGMRAATIYRADPRLEVGFCESSTSEQAIRAALAPTGFIAEGP